VTGASPTPAAGYIRPEERRNMQEEAMPPYLIEPEQLLSLAQVFPPDEEIAAAYVLPSTSRLRNASFTIHKETAALQAATGWPIPTPEEMEAAQRFWLQGGKR
jgi:hypothetical protein